MVPSASKKQQRIVVRFIAVHARRHPYVGRTFQNDNSQAADEAKEMQARGYERHDAMLRQF